MDDSFWLAVGTIVCGLLIFLLRTVFASKCREVDICWGCFRVDREVNLEMRDIRQSPERSRSNQEIQQPSIPVVRSRPNSRPPSPVSVVDIEKLDLGIDSSNDN
jgi:hypothetical protein